MKSVLLVAFVVGMVAASGCLGGGAKATASLRKISILSDNEGAAGAAYFNATKDSLKIEVSVFGLTAGEHGIHIHERGDCGPTNGTGPPSAGAGAGPHFNPDGTPHGEHAGDLGNLVVGADGRGTYSQSFTKLNLKNGDKYSIMGRSLVIHQNRDDGTTQPSGNSGGRIVCGVIIAS